MGNSLDQYRAAVGGFYTQCHNTLSKSVLRFSKSVNLLDFLLFICNIFKQQCKILSSWSLRINFFAQLFVFFILLLSGDIETNPGWQIYKTLKFSRQYKFFWVNVVVFQKMFEFIRWYYICSRLFIHVYLCVFNI